MDRANKASNNRPQFSKWPRNEIPKHSQEI